MASPNDTEVPSKRKRTAAQQPIGASLPPDEYIQGSFERVEDVFFHSNVVMHYSTCALIQRAVTTDNVTFTQECLEYSRAALIAHERCNAQFNTGGNEELWSGYIHWSILQAPFTPFIVVFCNAIQKSDTKDLESLQQFVASLESCRTVSEGANKLYKMCHLFLQVAKLYIQAKRNDARSQPQSMAQPAPNNIYTTTDGTQVDLNYMTQFDPYLSALGLVPNSAWPMAGYNDTPTISTAMETFGNTQNATATQVPDPFGTGYMSDTMPQNSVQDWFSGSRYLMNLMEAGDDMQMPDLQDFDVQL